jgi:hypothetical protein
MPLPSTYQIIATTTGTGSSSQITFGASNTIPQTYTDLVLIMSYIDVQIDNLGIRFNGDTGTNYSRTRFIGNGSSGSTATNSNQNYLYCGYKDSGGTSEPVNGILQIMNYSNSTTYKSALSRYSTRNSSGYSVIGEVYLWRITNPITQIDIYSGSANFSTNCKFTLYGIKAA